MELVLLAANRQETNAKFLRGNWQHCYLETGKPGMATMGSRVKASGVCSGWSLPPISVHLSSKYSCSGFTREVIRGSWRSEATPSFPNILRLGFLSPFLFLWPKRTPNLSELIFFFCYRLRDYLRPVVTVPIFEVF